MSVKFLALSGVGLLLTLTCLGIQGFFAENRCKVPLNGCEAFKEIFEEGCKQAPGVRFSDDSGSTSCRYRIHTTVIGIISLVVTFVALVFTFLLSRGKDNQGAVKATAGLSSIGLLITAIVIIVDVAKADKNKGESKSDLAIANIILTFFLLFVSVAIVIFARKN